jgi:2'-phosphotransferase
MNILSNLRCFGCIIFNNTLEKVLLVHAIPKGKNPGRMRNTSFTKGGKKNNETPIETAIREVREESGITEDWLTFAKNTYVIEKNNKGIDNMAYFICKLSQDYQNKFSYDPEEIEEIKWYTIKEARELFMGNRGACFNEAVALLNNATFISLDTFLSEIDKLQSLNITSSMNSYIDKHKETNYIQTINPPNLITTNSKKIKNTWVKIFNKNINSEQSNSKINSEQSNSKINSEQSNSKIDSEQSNSKINSEQSNNEQSNKTLKGNKKTSKEKPNINDSNPNPNPYNINLDKYSRSLTQMLRHDITSEGLTLDIEGYTSVDKVLKLRRFKYLTLNDVIYIVNFDKDEDKQRFDLRERDSKFYIRCNQGHSGLNAEMIDINKSCTLIKTPLEKCIHGTYMDAWNIIKIKGLSKMNRSHIHFALGEPNDKKVISGCRSSCTKLIYINMQLAMADGIKFYLSQNGVILSDGINGIIHPRYFIQ